jgi:hypothetical protein
MLMLGILGLAVGLTTLDPQATATQGVTAEAGWAAAAWGGVSMLVAFLIGGIVAARASAVFSHGWGAVNGAMVFLMALPVILVLAAMGLGGVLGTWMAFVQPGTMTFQPGSVTMQPGEMATAAQMARDTAFGAFIGGLLGLLAATLGGVIGTRRGVDVEGLPRYS